MTVLLPNSAFLHIPKTGGTWVRNALQSSGLHIHEVRAKTELESTESKIRSWHNVPLHNDMYLAKENIFCFIRNPFIWYQSYWSHKTGNDSWREHNVIDACKDDRFIVFIDNVLESFPDGYVTWLYDFYASHATFVGRTERLQQDLITALTLAGEDFLADDIINTPRAKVSSKAIKRKAIYRRDQIEKIATVEKQVIEKYGYHNTVSFLQFV